MVWYLIELRYVSEKINALRPAHRRYMHDLAVEGKVALAGLFADGSGGLFLYRADNEQELAELVDNDPYVAGGAVAHRTLRPFEPVIAVGIEEPAALDGG